ncbi:OVARIAN TUMOR DOMAIN-containing deubiquitinating enzyme 9-like isoform X1 [Punica granatum]|uniref:ubiquitinyl hydrolase 1 n=1 Tax=Punica granatum TaxID=22663 RepID=A0A6P8BS67_PUNGR|nr:OVARIAN TUMOR DOMAIN-containing deubiquitinating enzyme 9-like isoform X1 [Punica granatum]
MTAHDADVVRWGLHLLDVCSISNAGSCSSVTRYDPDLSQVQYVREGYVEADQACVENDEIIALAFQEELSRLALHEASAEPPSGMDDLQASILAQDWVAPSKRFSDTHPSVVENHHELAGDSSRKEEEIHDEVGTGVSYPSSGELHVEEDFTDQLDIADESLDGEVGKRLNQMVPIPHIPKVNGEMPSADEEVSDHQRLLDRLQLYDLVENKIQGDGNCQFRAISDQLYRSPEYHEFVRQEIVQQLKSHPELYDGYVPMAYADYLKKMSKCGEWGDHVTLQAAADSYGVKIFVITSFKDTCYVEILPHIQKSKRVIFLSFWAEVHYNSIYPEGDLPFPENRRKKKWWDVLKL